MKTRPVLLIVLALVLGLGALVILVIVLGAGSLFVIASSSGQQPTPQVETGSAAGYQVVEVDQVEVEVGVGSPIPVQVTVSGSLPDTCAQIEVGQLTQDGSDFHITLSSVPSSAEDCIQDTLPFRMLIPLNIVNLPAGSYSVEVNGSRTDFDLDTANTTSSLPAADSVIRQDDIQVDDVNIEVGVGSPIPVHAVVSLNLPNTCAQIGEFRLHRDGTTFFVQLIASTAERADCQAGSIPFRLEMPLNVVNLPQGPYEVNINGTTTSFDPTAMPSGDSNLTACTDPLDVPAINGQVSYGGISFELNPALGSAVIVQRCPELLFNNDQAPGEAHPPYTEFSFPNYDHKNTYFQPEVRVYEVTDDMQAYLYPLNMLDDLQKLVRQHAQPPTWFAAPLHTREAYLDFANGSGVRGLVEYMQDLFFFTNNGLIYEFNGLTQDGRYFVSVRYPLSVPFLMELDDPTLPPTNLNAQAIAIPDWPSDYEQQRQVIEAYNAEALTRFEGMAESDVMPALSLLDALVESIQVSKP